MDNQLLQENTDAIVGAIFLGLGVYGAIQIYDKYLKNIKTKGVNTYSKIKDWMKGIRSKKEITLNPDRPPLHLEAGKQKFLDILNQEELQPVKKVIDTHDLKGARDLQTNDERTLLRFRTPIVFYIFYKNGGETPTQIKNVSTTTFQMTKALYGQKYAKFVSDKWKEQSEKIVDMIIT